MPNEEFYAINEIFKATRQRDNLQKLIFGYKRTSLRHSFLPHCICFYQMTRRQLILQKRIMWVYIQSCLFKDLVHLHTSMVRPFGPCILLWRLFRVSILLLQAWNRDTWQPFRISTLLQIFQTRDIGTLSIKFIRSLTAYIMITITFSTCVELNKGMPMCWEPRITSFSSPRSHKVQENLSQALKSIAMENQVFKSQY